jgi:oxygen-independent coproporphyrinogen-3 oxidase
MQPQYSSLYVHFPFCETKCHYCDFYSLGRERTRDSDAPRFEEALLAETELRKPILQAPVRTVFFGGGTPSMTPPSTMALWKQRIGLDQLGTSDLEWTMEANPSSVEVDQLREYRKIGINRISMGVQAMRDDLLLRLGRVHSRDKALEALEAIFASGFDNVSVDLLCGVPGQTTDDIERAVAALSAFPITHLSCYLLTLPPHHRMYPELPNEEEQLKHLLFLDRIMTQRGFRHYEISNFAKPGKEARHNLVYWGGGSYLGLGPSAHSFDAQNGVRWKNFSSLHKWANTVTQGQLAVEQTETLSTDQIEIERWMLALRLDEGFPNEWLKSELQKKKAALFCSKGWMEVHPEKSDFLRLTPTGFTLSDQLVGELLR